VRCWEPLSCSSICRMDTSFLLSRTARCTACRRCARTETGCTASELAASGARSKLGRYWNLLAHGVHLFTSTVEAAAGTSAQG
jgi:hypothetical protein